MKRFTGFFDILKGAFRARFQPATLTANRNLTLADKSGTLAVMETMGATSANVRLNGITTYPTWTVTGAITFAVEAGAVAGSVAYVRLVANGTNIPAMGPFKRRADSRAYVNTSGTTNVFELTFDGTDYWYKVWAENSSTITTNGIMSSTEVDSVISSASILWSQITSRPTTLAGYGISNAATLDTVQTLTGEKSFSARIYTYLGGSFFNPSATTNSTIINQPVSGSVGQEALQVVGNSSTSSPAFIAFHRPGVYATFFGLDTDNLFAFGGWSASGGYVGLKAGLLYTFNAASVSPLRVVLNTPPANNATGTAGEIRIGTDGGVYICVSANSWRRVMATTY